MSETVDLTPPDIDDAKEIAAERMTRHRGHRGRYGNRLASHLVGALGEVALEKWARGLGHPALPLFREPSQEGKADVVVREMRLEAKTWAAGGWVSLGRCITPPQARTLDKKADAVVWCTWDEPTVTLMGWSTPEEVKAATIRVTGPEYWRVENHQVDIADMRKLSELKARIDSSTKSSA